MEYEVLSLPATRPDGKVPKPNPAFVLLYFICLGVAGFVFAVSCFVLFISGLVLDVLAFIGLLGVALGSLIWGRIKRIEARRVAGYFTNPVWK